MFWNRELERRPTKRQAQKNPLPAAAEFLYVNIWIARTRSSSQTAKLKWLQSCVLAIDPQEATIRAHLPLVLHQLKNALTTSTPIISQRGGPDVSVVRLTTHVVNSLASMLPPAGSDGS